MSLDVPDPQQALQWFAALPQSARGRFLAALAHNLTIAGRMFFDAFDPARTDSVRARAVNELLHQVTSYLHHIHVGDENLSWAPSVTKRVLEQNDPELLMQVHQAWRWAAEEMDA